MKLAIAADHAGYDLKETIRYLLLNTGHEVIDLGTDSADKPDDYPDFALALGKSILQKSAERGILVCGSGVGASIAANKIPGVRAAICHDHYSAAQGVEHDDMNVLVLGARVIGLATAQDLVTAFLNATYSGEERHARRLAKVLAIEANPPRS
ncbi:ribose 5-phosphate isomerase B [Telmatocola sphagniphila]|uniref:Ribose 5-phosphate isomerase B n=1 Tax=Telmatocola sphagniphila TaxID=1123043 RepID=A0A8E6F016_9BACT|nr:ribose 5-phosphate isomerase B [Telmatocola sphagniphila]QVL34313.1 ribose 5-phosphate isomerase B [Telmatocola sphagniphila]